MLMTFIYVYLYFYIVESRSEKKFKGPETLIPSFQRNRVSEEQDTKIRQKLKTLIWKSDIETSLSNHQGNKVVEEPISLLNAHHYPFVASIQRLGSHYATGTLVDKRWVLTCASDFYNVRESIKFYRVRLGSANSKRGGEKFPIKVIRIHPSFTPGAPSYDLALLRLVVPSSSTFVMRPLHLSKVTQKAVSAKFMTAYWPRIVKGRGSVLPPTAKERHKFTQMRISTQKLIPSQRCEQKVKNLQETSLCLVPIQTFHSVCSPDIGSPIIAGDGLWGVTSAWVSDECPENPGPTVFTRVSPPVVQKWLLANLNQTSYLRHHRGKEDFDE